MPRTALKVVYIFLLVGCILHQIKALQGLSLTLRDHTNTNLTKWTVYTGGYGVEISDSHQDQTITGLAFFQSRQHGLSKSREKARLQSG